jgi:hypothetical protein
MVRVFIQPSLVKAGNGFYGTHKQNFNGDSRVFEVKLFNGAIADAGRRRLKLEMQYSCRQTGSTYISGCRTDRREIPTALSNFSGLSISVELMSIQHDVDRHPKNNMAAAKPEVLISQAAGQIEEKFQRLFPNFSGLSISMELMSIHHEVDRHPKNNMAAAKPEV